LDRPAESNGPSCRRRFIRIDAAGEELLTTLDGRRRHDSGEAIARATILTFFY